MIRTGRFFLLENSILKNRELYKPKANKRGREIDIPYQPPGKFGHSTGPQCVVDVLTHWYPWYVQSSLSKHLLEKPDHIQFTLARGHEFCLLPA